MQLRVRDVARVLEVSERTVRQWVRNGGLAAQRAGGQLHFNRSDLLEWATARNLRVSAELFGKSDPDAAPLAGLSEALATGGVFHDVEGSDKESVLHAIVERMPLPAEVERPLLFGILLAREALGSTAVGDGIAIPHVRNPITLHVAKPTITLCFLKTPIDFGALDRRPVHALFSMISPSIRAHLHLLSRLGFALKDPAFKALIERRTDREKILEAVRKLESEM
ncbi:MAG: PTS sugar transporter subunit IIA [Kiritimatiellae bacterium]|nr:PTS sugar transporter subunit IIA [Kiritimatiellia bacterium]